MSKEAIGDLGLDRVIHERARLVILSYLASATEPELGFTELRNALGFTAGNLSIQLKTLSEAGFVRIEKRFRDNKPYTGASLTAAGSEALSNYLAEIAVLLESVREGRGGVEFAKASGSAPEGEAVPANPGRRKRSVTKED